MKKITKNEQNIFPKLKMKRLSEKAYDLYSIIEDTEIRYLNMNKDDLTEKEKSEIIDNTELISALCKDIQRRYIDIFQIRHKYNITEEDRARRAENMRKNNKYNLNKK